MKRTVSFALVFAACGTLDAPATPPIVDPGKGPYRDAGGLEMCLGTARLVARQGAAGANGVCVDPTQSERSCAADEGCGHGESCICGRCILPACTGTQPCGDGKICRGDRCTIACTTDGQCTGGDVCANGGCTRKCADSSECGFGGKCDSLDQVCIATTCEVDDDCATGRVCARVQRAGDVHEPAFLPGDALLVEVREGGGKNETFGIFSATRDADRRYRLADPPVVTGAGGPAPLIQNGVVVALFAAVPDGSALVRYSPSGGDPTSVLVPDQPWEAGRVTSPSAIAFAGAVWLFYEIGASAGVGLARLDASLAVVEKRGPFMTPTSLENPGYFRDVDRSGTPEAVVSNGVVLLYVTAHGVEGTTASQGTMMYPAEPNDSVAMAASADLVRFDLAPQNPLFARRTNLRTYLGEREPTVRLEPNGASILFVASDATGNLDGIALATSPLGHYACGNEQPRSRARQRRRRRRCAPGRRTRRPPAVGAQAQREAPDRAPGGRCGHHRPRAELPGRGGLREIGRPARRRQDARGARRARRGRPREGLARSPGEPVRVPLPHRREGRRDPGSVREVRRPRHLPRRARNGRARDRGGQARRERSVRGHASHGEVPVEVRDEAEERGGRGSPPRRDDAVMDPGARATRLAAAGAVGASVVHELRNALAVVSSSLYLARRDRAVEEKLLAHLDKASAEVHRAQAVVAAVLGLARGEALAREATSVAKLVATARSGFVLPTNVTFSTAITPQDLLVACDPVLLERVLSNLYLNAIEALAGRGRGAISTRIAKVGDAVEIVVEDDGPGIDPSHVQAIFDPLFTTKEAGTGLGLALVRAVAEAHGGSVEAGAREGAVGARFTVRIPV